MAQSTHYGTYGDSEEQLRIIFEQAGIGMGRVLPTGQWIQVNKKLCSLLGYTATELLGKKMADVLHPEDLELSRHMYAQLADIQCPQDTLEKRYITKRGDVLWTSTTISAVRDHSDPTNATSADHTSADSTSNDLTSTDYPQKNLPNNLPEPLPEEPPPPILYFIVTIQDITERKKAVLALENQKNDLLTVNLLLTDTMSRLEQRNQELDQFAYVTSHDLKAPLRAIVNLASWIEEDLGETLPQENKGQFQLLKSRVHRMEGLINGLLEYSQVDRTHQSHERVDTAILIQDVVDSLAVPKTFTIEIAPNLPVIQAKKVCLIQIFSNLIDNAITHHNRQDGKVQITARDEGSHYEFSVIDDGPGIDAAYHEKVFVIFQTLQARDEFESTGIGLSLVKKIVLAEGGQIAIDSTLGKGSTFRVTWPKTPYTGI